LIEAQLKLERINNNKLTQMLSVHNSSSDKTCLVYVASSFDIASTSKIVFVKPTVPEPQIAYVDKDKGITGGEINVSVEPVKSSLNKKSLPTCYHCGISGHIRPNYPQLRAHKPTVKKEELRKAKSSIQPPKAHQAPLHQKQQQRFIPASRQFGKILQNKSRYFKLKPHEPNNNHLYEGLLSMMQSALSKLDILDKAFNLAPRVKKVWVRKDETIHPLRES
jgi:hypothetical protein